MTEPRTSCTLKDSRRHKHVLIRIEIPHTDEARFYGAVLDWARERYENPNYKTCAFIRAAINHYIDHLSGPQTK